MKGVVDIFFKKIHARDRIGKISPGRGIKLYLF